MTDASSRTGSGQFGFAFRATATPACSKAVQMYKCEFCQQLQAADVPSVLVPIQTRPVTYPYRKGVHPPLSSKGDHAPRRRRHVERRDDPGGQGRETV